MTTAMPTLTRATVRCLIGRGPRSATRAGDRRRGRRHLPALLLLRLIDDLVDLALGRERALARALRNPWIAADLARAALALRTLLPAADLGRAGERAQRVLGRRHGPDRIAAAADGCHLAGADADLACAARVDLRAHAGRVEQAEDRGLLARRIVGGDEPGAAHAGDRGRRLDLEARALGAVAVRHDGPDGAHEER